MSTDRKADTLTGLYVYLVVASPITALMLGVSWRVFRWVVQW